MDTFVVRLWLPDRPGALGQVASRIGAVHADVVGIEILERGGGSAIDDLTISLPDARLVDLLISEIRQVEGVGVEHVRPVAADRPDGSMAVLATASAIVTASAERRLDQACTALRDLLDADWAIALCVRDSAAVAQSGPTPELEWLAAFLAGSEHLGDDHESDHTPGDLAWARLPRHGVAMAAGRAGRVFHSRERDEFRMLCGIADALD